MLSDELARIKKITEYMAGPCLADAENGDVQAQKLIVKSLLSIGEYSAAFPWIRRLTVITTDPEAMAQYADCLLFGRASIHGEPQNVLRGIKFLEQAGELGYGPAYITLCHYYTNGAFGIIKSDLRVAIRYAEMAVDKSCLSGLDLLCELYGKCEAYDKGSLDDGYISEAFGLFHSALKQSNDPMAKRMAQRFLTRKTRLLYGERDDVMTLKFPDATCADIIPVQNIGLVSAFAFCQKALTRVPAAKKEQHAWDDNVPAFDIEVAEEDFLMRFLDNTAARIRLIERTVVKPDLSLAAG